jgi:hypothetical protein
VAEGFFGGFAQGFSSAYGRGMQDKRLREQLGYDQQRLDWQKTQGEQQLEISRQTLEQQKAYQGGELALRQQDFTRQQAQDAALVEHQKYGDFLESEKTRILQEKQKLDAIDSMQKAIFTPGLTENQRKATAMGYMLANKIDPKSEAGKQFMLLTVDPQVTDEQRAEAGSLITNYLADLPPPAVNYLFDKFHNNPPLLIDALTKLKAQKDAAQLKEVADSTSSTGRRWMPQGEAAHMEAPAPAPTVSISDKTESEKSRLAAQAESKRYNEIIVPQGEKAAGDNQIIGALQTVQKEGHFKTGAIAQPRMFLGQLIELFGGDPTKIAGDPASAETFSALASQLAVNVAQGLSRVSNLSIGMSTNTVPNLSKTPEGNAILLELKQRQNDRAVQIKHKADEMMHHGEKTLYPENGPSIDDFIDRLDASDPVINDSLRKKIETTAKTGAAMTWDDAVKVLKEGMTEGSSLLSKGADAASTIMDKGTSAAKSVINDGTAYLDSPKFNSLSEAQAAVRDGKIKPGTVVAVPLPPDGKIYQLRVKQPEVK